MCDVDVQFSALHTKHDLRLTQKIPHQVVQRFCSQLYKFITGVQNRMGILCRFLSCKQSFKATETQAMTVSC